MLNYIIRRLLISVVVLIAIATTSFFVIQLPPGDFASTYKQFLIQTGGLTEDRAEEMTQLVRQQYGLDRPMYVQYLKWMGLMLRGNFGMAMEYNRPVREVIGDRLTLTMVVSIAAIVFIWGLALPIGIYSAVYKYSWGDYFFTFLAFLGIGIPNFMLALVILYMGFKYFDMQSIGGLFSEEYMLAPWSLAKVWDMMKHLPLPAVILGMAGIGELVRIMRANLLDELRKPYVVTARAKGLSQTRVIMKYPVRAALNPFASTIGYIFPYVVSGSIIVSLVLSLPTVGPLLFKALIAQDLFLAGTILLLLAVMTVIGTLISDLILMWIDPRIRMGMEGSN
jgi:peptide/nickel transport system permease protein